MSIGIFYKYQEERKRGSIFAGDICIRHRMALGSVAFVT